MATWTEEETTKLIEIWSEDAIQAMLEGSRRNREIFIRISKEMENCGFCKSGDQCSCKIKKLRFEYKKIKDTMGKTGRGRKNWKYFEAMDQVLGHKPATRPPVVIESGESSMSCDPETSAPSPTSLSSSILNETEDSILEESEVGYGVLGSGSQDRDDISRLRSETPKTEQGKNRKRKRGGDKFEKLEGFLEKVVRMQEENDAASRRMEEKLLEMEERRDRENREFQLQMMAILAGQTQTPGHNYFPFNNYTYPFIPPSSHSQPAPQSQHPPQSQPSHSQLPHSQDNYDEFNI